MNDLFAFVLRRPPRRSFPRSGELPFELQLKTGVNSITILPEGAYVAFSFFQRQVHSEHDLEYLATQPTAAEAEASALLRLLAGRPLAPAALTGAHSEALWEALGLSALPPFGEIAQLRCERADSLGGQRYWLEPRTRPRVHHRSGRRRFTCREVLEELGRLLPGEARIAWIEEGIQREEGCAAIIQRYYLLDHHTLVMVRDRGPHGRTLHRASLSPRALLRISGALRRRAA